MAININHHVTLFGQPTNMTCWSAAATMLFGNMSVGPGSAKLSANGGLESSPQNIQAFANSHSLTLHYPMSWTVEGLANLLRRKPLMICGSMPSGHAVVLAGMVGDGTPTGTLFPIYDPWPPNVGTIRRNLSYQSLMSKFPMFTTYILHR